MESMKSLQEDFSGIAIHWLRESVAITLLFLTKYNNAVVC